MIGKLSTCFVITTVFLLPMVSSSYGNMRELDDSFLDEESSHEVALLLSKCLKHTSRLVTLRGKVSRNLAEKIHKLESTAVIRMSTEVPFVDKAYILAKQSQRVYDGEFYFRFEHKAQGFVLAASSQPILRRQLIELKNSRWWKARGIFLIVNDHTTIIDGCKNAQRFLRTVWHYNILSAIFLCRDENEILVMYSYNPYNSMAPENWLKVGQNFGRGGHPWIFLKRNASESTEDCGDIFFDKTKTLDGYKVRVNAAPFIPHIIIDDGKTGLERYGGQEGEMTQCIFNFVNGSVQDVPYKGNHGFGYTDENGTYFGMIKDVSTERVDIGLNGRYMVEFWNLGMTIPYTSAALCFIVKSRGYVPRWISLVSVFDLWTSLGLILAIFLTTTVLSYYSSLSAGCLNTLRLIISSSALRLPSQNPARVFLINVLFLSLIASGTFQGRLVSLLTKPRARRNPETQKDLADAGYKVGIYRPFASFIDDPVLRSRVEPILSPECIERSISGEMITCMIDCQATDMRFKDPTKFHIVSQKLQTFHLVFPTTLDWPLLDRFNQLIGRLCEAGLPDYWESYDAKIDTAHYYKEQLARGDRSPSLYLVDLTFIFHFLVFGLSLATLVFFHEVLRAWLYRNRCSKNPPVT